MQEMMHLLTCIEAFFLNIYFASELGQYFVKMFINKCLKKNFSRICMLLLIAQMLSYKVDPDMEFQKMCQLFCHR